MNKRGLKKVIGDNLYLLKLCFKAAPLYVILFIVETVRNEAVIFLEFTFGLNYVRLNRRRCFWYHC